MIIPALYKRQKERGGYLTEQDQHAVSEELGISLHRVQAVVSFFPHFRVTPPPKLQVQICRDMSCHLRGSTHVTQRLQQWAAQEKLEDVEVCSVSCLGRCDRAPAAIVNENLYVNRDETELQEIITSFLADEPKAADTDQSLALSKVGQWEMDPYTEDRNYSAVRSYAEDLRPETVLDALQTAGLLGMGGAGGRTYLKWSDVMQAEGKEKYVVCNADESEPGTFKDREILLAAPHLTIEGMILAGLVVGASRGWVYIRHEYPEQVASVEREIARARSLGALGRNIFGCGKSFRLEVFVSPGGYICGEQTALIEAMENKRAEPRNRPPELMTNGYLNQPTLLNNVETFAWVPAIALRADGKWYAEQGKKEGPWVAGCSEAMRGKRLFSISGDVARPGVYEVPTGISLGELIDDCCGGMSAGKSLVAVALSGPSGGLLPAQIPIQLMNKGFIEKYAPPGMTHFDIRDLPLDINVARAARIMVGAGIVIYGTGTDVVAEAVANSRFFRNETCGKCVPCRLGSQKITEMGESLLSGNLEPGQLPVIRDTTLQLADVMRATSICGLGQVASNPLSSLLTYFPDAVAKACSRHKT